MGASMTSAVVRIRRLLGGLAVAAMACGLLFPEWAEAAPPGARTTALTPLEEGLIVTPDLEPAQIPQPVLAYVELTEDGIRLNFLPGAVRRPGPLPVLTTSSDAALEDLSSRAVAPYLPLLRVDF